jgi:hypothetical protein
MQCFQSKVFQSPGSSLQSSIEHMPQVPCNSPLRYEATYFGGQVPMFYRNFLPPFSTLMKAARLLQNIGTYPPNNSVTSHKPTVLIL